jgi:RHS repeat-associated protein
MSLMPNSCLSNPRLVGDPVDVVTGANTDMQVDLVQRGPIPFKWARYYSSARVKILCSLGWGQSHDFDRVLYRDLEGLRYEDPSGAAIAFPDLAVGDSAAAAGLMLSRIGENSFVVSQPGEPSQEFEFPIDADSARLARLRQRKDTIEFRYADGCVLQEIVDSRGRSIRVTNDDIGRIVQLALIDRVTGDVRHVLLAYEYDVAGNIVWATDVNNTTQLFAYDADNRMTRRTDRNGYSFHFEYDEQGRCIHSRGEDGLFEVFLDYQSDAKVTFVRRGDGGQWIYAYNASGTVTEITDPYGGVTRFTVDETGRVTEEIDPNGDVTQLHYDSLGQHDYRIDPNGYVLPNKADDPDPSDPLAYELPPTALEWEFGHLLDAALIQPPRQVDALLAQFPTSVVNLVLGKTTSYDGPPPPAEENGDESDEEQLDDFGRPLEQAGKRHREHWRYDPNGNEIEHRDRDGAVYRSTYHSWNALQEEIDPLGNVTRYEQNVQGLVSKVIDPGGTVTEYGYDLRDQLVEVHRNGRLRERYRLDTAGNVIGKEDSQGRRAITWEIGPGSVDKVRELASGETHTFEHDEHGRVTAARTPAGEATFAYDEDGRLLADLRDGMGVVHKFDLGQLIGTTYFDKFKVTYETDDDGDLIVLDPLGGRHRFQRNEHGLVCKSLANGVRELCQFDIQGRCLRKALLRTNSGAIPWMRSHAYSSSGNLVAVSDTLGGLSRYSYDAAHRLTEEVLSDGTARRFEYDAAGNLHAQPGLANVVLDKGNRLAEANGDCFTYNDREHLSQRTGPRGTTRYEYDDLDRLVRCDINGAAWTASYDADCRRVTKTWEGRTTTYYWDNFRLAAEVRYDGSVRIYVYVDETALVPFLFIEYAGLEAAPESGQPYYVFTNQIGAPIRAEDAQGSPCWTARIDPYGRADVSSDSTLEMSLRFPGHYHDAETGLHYNRFRYFSPELGRYLQSDPLGLGGAINTYAYPAQPLNSVDIDGLGTKPRKSGTKKEQELKHARAMCRQHPRGTQEGDDWRYKRYCGRLALKKPPETPKPRSEWDKTNKGGIRGKDVTRSHIDKERDRILSENADWQHTHGGTDRVTGAPKPELHIPGPGGGQEGSTRPDLTFKKPDGSFHHHNTVDTNSDGTMTDREAQNLARLQAARPEDTTSTSPKPE